VSCSSCSASCSSCSGSCSGRSGSCLGAPGSCSGCSGKTQTAQQHLVWRTALSIAAPLVRASPLLSGRQVGVACPASGE
jgi:hypothetical protein